MQIKYKKYNTFMQRQEQTLKKTMPNTLLNAKG